MAPAKVLLAFVACALLLSSASAQNVTNTTTAANATTPANATNATTPAAANATTAPVLNTTTALLNASAANVTQLPSAPVLAIYQAVKARGLSLLQALTTGNLVGVSNYVTPDVALVLPNTSAPITLANTSTLLPFFTSLTPPAGSNASVANISELFFYVVDSSNVVTVYEVVAGQLGNVYITGFWQLLNSTTSTNGSWSAAYASIAPAPTTPYVPQTFPTFGQTPNITILTPNSTLNNNATNSTGALNSTSLFVNSSAPVNTTVESQVVAASTAFQTAINNASLSFANVTSQFVAPNFTIVVPQTTSPIGLNLTNPTIAGLFTALRAANTSGNAPGQTVIAYKQLNQQAGVLTTQVSGVPTYGNVYFIQLWQLLNASTGSNTTTGVNTTIIANRTSAPLAQSWQLTFASLNIAPTVAGNTPTVNGTLLAPAPAPAPGTSSSGVTSVAPTIAVAPTTAPTTSPTPTPASS